MPLADPRLRSPARQRGGLWSRSAALGAAIKRSRRAATAFQNRSSTVFDPPVHAHIYMFRLYVRTSEAVSSHDPGAGEAVSSQAALILVRLFHRTGSAVFTALLWTFSTGCWRCSMALEGPTLLRCSTRFLDCRSRGSTTVVCSTLTAGSVSTDGSSTDGSLARRPRGVPRQCSVQVTPARRRRSDDGCRPRHRVLPSSPGRTGRVRVSATDPYGLPLHLEAVAASRLRFSRVLRCPLRTRFRTGSDPGPEGPTAV